MFMSALRPLLVGLVLLVSGCAEPAAKSSATLSIGDVFDRAEAIVTGEVLRLEEIDETWSKVSFAVQSVPAGPEEAQALDGSNLEFPIPTPWTYGAQPESVRELYGEKPPPVTSAALIDTGDEKALFLHRSKDGRWLLTDRSGIWGWDGERAWPGNWHHEGSLRTGGKRGEVELARSAAGVEESLAIPELLRLWKRERSSRSDVELSYLHWPTAG